MKAIIVEPDARPRVADIQPGLRSLRAILCRNGGHIEVVYPFEDNVGIICNDEGKLLSLPLNRALRNENGDVYDVICGNFIIAGLTEEDFTDLTDEQVEKYTQMFYKKELFIRKGQRLVSFTV